MPTTADVFTAIQQGDLAELEALLAAHPEFAEARNEQGLSAVVFALYLRQPALAEALGKVRKTPLDLAEAVALGRQERAREVLANDDVAVHRRTPDGFAPLHYAAFFDHPELITLLLEHGADVRAVADNPTRVQPLHSAVAMRSVEACRRLLAAGADANARQQGGFTPLQGAAGGDRRDLVELLLAHGARRDERSDDGKTAADIARDKGHAEMADLLA